MKITLRELLLLTVIVALGLGWWIDKRNSRTAQEKCESACKQIRENHRRLVDGLLELERSPYEGEKDGMYITADYIWILTPGGYARYDRETNAAR